jgi:ATP-binding cassette subfamily C protein CydC
MTGTVAAFNYLLPSAAIRALAIVRTVGRYGERLEGHRAALKALAGIRPEVFAGLVRQPPQRALELSTGEAVSRMVGDVDGLETLFIRRSGIWSAIAAAGSGVGLTALAGWPSALAFAGLFGVQVMGSLALSGLAAADGRALQQDAGRLKDRLAAILSASEELAAYDLVNWAVERAGAAGDALGHTRRRLHQAEGRQAAFNAVLSGVAVVAVLALALASRAPLPLAALAGLAAGACLEGASGMARALLDGAGMREAARRIDAVLTSEPAATGHPPRSASLAFSASGGAWIELRPGERLALLGASGCGKTTLLERLLKLRPDVGWPIRVGGETPAVLADAEMRALFAYAPQDAALLSGSIRENLAVADPRASEADLWAALRDAALDERVRRAPQGLDTWVGDVGERLSGGERRRLCLARAFLRPAPWLMLDEPSEGLDAETERQLIERVALRLERTGQGLILVSHRPGPRRLCNRFLDLSGAPLIHQAA